MRLQDKKQLDLLIDSAVGFGRHKLNSAIYTLASIVARSSASITTTLVLAFFGFNAFLFFNVASAFGLASLFFDNNMALGFLAIASIYILGVLIYLLLLRRKVEGKIKNEIAYRAISSVQNLNEELDKNPRLKMENSQVLSQQWVSRPVYTNMVELKQDADFKAYNALNNVKYAGAYFVGNYKEVAKQTAFAQVEAKAPGRRFITPILKMMGYQPEPKPSPSLVGKDKQEKTNYMPYVRFALDIARPVLIAFTVGKLRGGLGYLLGLTAKKKGR